MILVYLNYIYTSTLPVIDKKKAIVKVPVTEYVDAVLHLNSIFKSIRTHILYTNPTQVSYITFC